MRDRLAALNEEIREEFGVEIGSRTGIHTGEVAVGDPDTGQTS